MTERKDVTAQVRIKSAAEGTVEAVFATFDVIDHDGDVIRRGAIRNGQKVRISAHGHASWGSALPVGKGTIHAEGNEAVLRGRLFLDTEGGRETFETLKGLGDLAEWSFGFNVTDSGATIVDGTEAREIRAVDVHEVSPVLIGAGIGTRTLALKGAKTAKVGDLAHAARAREAFKRAGVTGASKSTSTTSTETSTSDKADTGRKDKTMSTTTSGPSLLGYVTKRAAGWETGTVEADGLATDTKAFRKDIISSQDTGAGFRQTDHTGIVSHAPRRRLKLRDLISVRETTEARVQYVRNVARTSAAAVVDEAHGNPASPSGGAASFSSWETEEVTETVYAVEDMAAITRASLTDGPAVQGFVDNELRHAVATVAEDLMISGEGDDEDEFEGILERSGTLSQDFAGSVGSTLTAAIARAETDGGAAVNGILIHPNDWRDLADGVTDGAALTGRRQWWEVPMVLSTAVEPGTAIVADWSQAVLWQRGTLVVSFTQTHEDWFARNLVAVSGVQAAAFGVLRPEAFVIADLADE